MKNISILGATGSIGTQTLEVIRKSSDEYTLVGVTANSNYDEIINIIKEFTPKYVALMDEEAFAKVKSFCDENHKDISVFKGIEGLNKVATMEECHMVVTSVVGMIGLRPTIKAIEAGKDIALANKETLVVAGEIVMETAKKHNVKILPVDSEHGAIFQCIQGNKLEDIDKILVTASGGPFRGKTRDELKTMKADQALRHPKWNMGRKISIDSSTLMNKGLEVIEAHWLFGVDYDQIEVVVHPQSIIHSMVQYKDGSVMAQLAVPDMKLPIQYALSYPYRKKAVIDKLDFYTMGTLEFEKPDMDSFKCLKLAYEAGKRGGNIPAILNGANEIAVELFLDDKISYLQIDEIIEQCINNFEYIHKPTLEEIIETDCKVKEYIRNKYS